MSKKRRRDPGTIDTQLVEIYEDLANESGEIRLSAAQSLLQKFSVENSPSKEKVLDVLTRLVRGLCSGRKSARLGFSVAFTEFLVQHLVDSAQNVSDRLGFSEALDLLIKQTEIGGKVSGQEERDHQLGRVFGIEAVIKSGVLFGPDTTNDSWSHILEHVFVLAKKKAWLREECGWILYKSIQNLKTKAHGEIYAQKLVDKFIENGLAKSPEGVATWLGIQSAFPAVSLPTSVWHHQNPLHRKEKATLSKILKDASAAGVPQGEANSKVTQNSTWSPNLHFAWDVVLSSIIQPDIVTKAKNTEAIEFIDFWIEAVDNGLFSSSASDQRKYWGFVLFQRAFLIAPPDLISVVFSKNFMRCFMNQLASPDRYLHRNAEKVVKSIYSRLETDSSIAMTVLACLLKAPNGCVNFDQITKTKTVEKLLPQVNDNNLGDLVKFYAGIMQDPNIQEEKAASLDRQIAADHLLSVVRSRQTITDIESSMQSGPTLFVKKVLVLFAQQAYFFHEQKSSFDNRSISLPISDGTRSVLRSRISSCLTHVLSKFAQPAHITYDLVHFICSLEKGNNDFKLLFECDEAVSKAINKGWTLLEKVHSKAAIAQGSRKRSLSAFELLYTLVYLQIYNGDADAVGMLGDLKSCYDSLFKHKSKSEQADSDGLVEILLGFVSKPSVLFRRLASQVFSTCTSDVSDSGLQSMIKILETKESKTGQEELFDEEAEDGESDDDASDVELVPNNDGDPAASSSAKGTGTSEEEDDDDSTAAAEELAAFDAKLAQALTTRPATDDLTANENDSSSDESMNDSQMEALDTHLETIFRERKHVKTKKTQNKDAKEAIINFKCRVLELLEIYIKQEHANPRAMQLLLPLLHLVRTTKTSLVSGKACDLIGTYFKLCKANSSSVPAESPDASEATIELLRSVHQQAAKDGSNAYSSACSRASLLLVKILVAQDRENLRRVEAVYGQTHERFMLDKRSKVRPSFFSDWLNWSVSARKS
ncbi:MAG: hypothetical protein Q9195_000096 [Heterodermia aff. obscurata]